MLNCDDILSVTYAHEYVMFYLLQFHLQEMADPRLRGTLAACIVLSYHTGFVLIHLTGFSISWNISAGLGAGIALIDLVSYSRLHDSPVWYVRHSRIGDARNVFSWLWGSGHEVEVRLTHPVSILLPNGRHTAGSYSVVHDLDCSPERGMPLLDQH